MADEATNDATSEVVEDATQDATDVVDESTVDDTPNQEGSEALGDPGKKALDSMKTKWREAEQRARENESALEALKAQVEGREVEYAAEQERRTIESDALAKANERILKAEIRAAGAAKLTDPADALRFLELSEFEVDDEGNVDPASITTAIDSLVESKPYLAAQGGSPGVVFESPGSYRNGKAGQVTKAELGRMAPDEINAARAEGRLDDLLGINN